MKKLFLANCLLFLTFLSVGQCPDCTIDESCTNGGGLPMMCPETLPPGTAGEYYEQNITVWLPSQVTDPDSGVTVDLLEVTVTNVTGMPFGMQFVMNNPDNTYFPQEYDFGCSTACGVPLLAGDYEIIITANVLAIALGFEVDVVQTFSLFFTVLPGSGGNNTFTFDNLAGCGSATVNFEGLINADPQPTTWNWDFGNENSSAEQFPPTQNYNEPGEYLVTLQTTIFNYVLTDVLISSVADGWWGDIEELTSLQNPDPFFIITNGNGDNVYTSTTIDNAQSGSWSNIDLILNDPPYTISFYDEDTFSDNDFLGDYVLPQTDGSIIFNADGTNGSLNIALQEGDVFNDEETINVFPVPNPVIQLNEDEEILYFDDPDLESYIWFFNTDTIANAVDSALQLEAGGIYSAIVFNIYGCQGLSEEFVYCPGFSLTYDGELGIFNAPEGYLSYQWFYNGLPLDGENDYFLEATEYGNYAVEVTTDYGCEITSAVFILSVGVATVAQEPNFNIYPNPASGQFTVETSSLKGNLVSLEIYSSTGKLVHLEQGDFGRDDLYVLSAETWDSGIYIVILKTEREVHQQALMVIKR